MPAKKHNEAALATTDFSTRFSAVELFQQQHHCLPRRRASCSNESGLANWLDKAKQRRFRSLSNKPSERKLTLEEVAQLDTILTIAQDPVPNPMPTAVPDAMSPGCSSVPADVVPAEDKPTEAAPAVRVRRRPMRVRRRPAAAIASGTEMIARRSKRPRVLGAGSSVSAAVDVFYYSINDLCDFEECFGFIAGFLEEHPDLGYKKLVRLLAAEGVHVTETTARSYLERLNRISVGHTAADASSTETPLGSESD